MVFKTLKSTGDIANLHDLRSIPRTRRSAKPQLPTTAILDLYMARNERDRLAKERMRLAKRKIQIDKRLAEIDGEMDDLLQRARKKAAEIRGERRKPLAIEVPSAHGGLAAGGKGQRRARLVVGY